VYRCPDNHGYFFPAGQLPAFKKAQTTKIDYFKLWHIPAPSVASVLLAGLVITIIAGGGYVALQNIGVTQTTSSQAQEVFTSQSVYIAPGTDSVLFTANTSIDADVVLRVPLMNDLKAPMQTTDHKTHTYFMAHVPPGPHTYFFQITAGGKETASDIFDFSISQ
jgi:galactitol-specific phosphotransferase system IIC component